MILSPWCVIKTARPVWDIEWPRQDLLDQRLSRLWQVQDHKTRVPGFKTYKSTGCSLLPKAGIFSGIQPMIILAPSQSPVTILPLMHLDKWWAPASAHNGAIEFQTVACEIALPLFLSLCITVISHPSCCLSAGHLICFLSEKKKELRSAFNSYIVPPVFVCERKKDWIV